MFDSPAKNRLKSSFKSLLKEKPFSGIKVKDVVERANVSSMTFYRNFADKADLTESICFEDLMLFTKIYGSTAEIRSITVCMLNTIRNNKDYYGNILRDDSGRASFLNALNHVSEETAGKQAAPLTLSACGEILKKWANEDFVRSVDDLYLEWISNLPLKAFLKGKELEMAIKAYEAKTIEDFRRNAR